MAFQLTAGNVDKTVTFLANHLRGKLDSIKGNITLSLLQTLVQQSLQLIPNTKNELVFIYSKFLLYKSGLSEYIFVKLQNKYQIGHTRHLNLARFLVSLLASLSAYFLKINKPSLNKNFVK